VFLYASTSFSSAQALSDSVCSFSGSAHGVLAEAKQFGIGLTHVPRAMIRPENLKWELPIAATTGVLIAKADRPAADRIQSHSLISTSRTWSNVGLGLELGTAGIAWASGCAEHRSHAARAGFAALTAFGAAATIDLALKLAFDRQFPYTPNSTGRFWGGGRSFPSGHSATSFAFAAAIAHYYPHNRWAKWGAYALATGVAVSRYPAKRHYPSDIVMGATLGYVTGEYVASH
jgi:undecaprenyl-diphosphatase